MSIYDELNKLYKRLEILPGGIDVALTEMSIESIFGLIMLKFVYESVDKKNRSLPCLRLAIDNAMATNRSLADCYFEAIKEINK